MKSFLLKMFFSFIIGGILSYIAIYVAEHYICGRAANISGFDLRKPVEFILVFSTNMFFSLFAFKSFDEILEATRSEEIIFNPPKKEEVYTLYEEVKRNK